VAEIQEQILSYFKKTQTIDLATCDGVQPRVRPMTMVCHQQRFFLATGSSDAKTKQVKQNPFAEILLPLHTEHNSGYIRISGKLQFVCDQALRKEIADISGYIYDYWQDSTNPDYILFEFLPIEAQLLLPGEMISTNIIWNTHTGE